MRRFLYAAALLFIAAGVTSCTFRRTIVNENFRNLDTSGIVVGQTTWMEALEKLGPPTILKVQENATSNVSERHLRYASSDVKTIGFNVGYYIILPFAWADEQADTVTLIEFDENGVVSRITRETIETKWRPFHQHAPGPTSVVPLKGGI